MSGLSQTELVSPEFARVTAWSCVVLIIPAGAGDALALCVAMNERSPANCVATWACSRCSTSRVASSAATYASKSGSYGTARNSAQIMLLVGRARRRGRPESRPRRCAVSHLVLMPSLQPARRLCSSCSIQWRSCCARSGCCQRQAV